MNFFSFSSGLGSKLTPEIMVTLEHVCPCLLEEESIDEYWRVWVIRCDTFTKYFIHLIYFLEIINLV